jgi:peptidoglycan L-alanyl-D-glutamate endopeptidase CwlK
MIGRAADFERRPELANEPALASDILAALLAARRQAIKQALVESDLVRARRLVNGGRHGLDRFAAAYAIGERRLADEVWLPKPRDADSTYAPALVA